MQIYEIKKFPTSINNTHESCYRYFHVVEKAKEYLSRGVPADVLLELIVEMEMNP